MMKRLKYILLFISIPCFIFQGCGREELPSDHPPVSGHRTVIVYLATDNNFRNETAQKIEQLKDNWNRTIDGNLLVYADAGEKPVLVHIYYTEQRGNVADTIEIYSAENSANPATFSRVLHRAKSYRPAASYGLVVLSHATGWLPAEMSHPAIRLKSVIQDTGTSEAGNYMELADFADAIPYKLDFIVFDACFMGSVEVCYELKDKVDHIVASPTEVLSPGFVYPTMMQHLFAPVADLQSIAREFYEYYNNASQTGLPRSATVSVVKTAGLEALATVVKDMTRQNALPDDLGNIQTYGYGAQKIYFDLEDYLQKRSPENHQVIQAAFNQCVTYKASTPSYYSAATGMQPVHAFSGLSAYIPQTAYPEANEVYGKLKWSKRTDASKH